MAKKVTYMRGQSAPQKFGDGTETYPVTTFWHIQKSRSKSKVLCGNPLHGHLETATKLSKTDQKDTCTFCTRISEGRDPVFDASSASRSAGRRDKGTRARPKEVVLNGNR